MLHNGVAAHEHGTFQRLRDTKRYIFKATRLMCHQYSYGSSAECLGECTRGSRRGTSNKRVCSRDIEGQLRKESIWFQTKSHSAPSREVRKVQYHSEPNTSRDTQL